MFDPFPWRGPIILDHEPWAIHELAGACLEKQLSLISSHQLKHSLSLVDFTKHHSPFEGGHQYFDLIPTSPAGEGGDPRVARG